MAAHDEARDFGERSGSVAAVEHAVFEDGHLMLDAAPLAWQDGAWVELTNKGGSTDPPLHITGD